METRSPNLSAGLELESNSQHSGSLESRSSTSINKYFKILIFIFILILFILLLALMCYKIYSQSEINQSYIEIKQWAQ